MCHVTYSLCASGRRLCNRLRRHFFSCSVCSPRAFNCGVSPVTPGPRSDLIRLSSTVSPPDPDAPSAEPKFSLMHEYSWIIPPSSPSSASALASEGAFEFWGPAASPHRLSVVCAADGSARVRACIRSNPTPSPPAPSVLFRPLRHTLCQCDLPVHYTCCAGFARSEGRNRCSSSSPCSRCSCLSQRRPRHLSRDYCLGSSLCRGCVE
jgi:hypothetical protein